LAVIPPVGASVTLGSALSQSKAYFLEESTAPFL
jgi:hypothetical protein